MAAAMIVGLYVSFARFLGNAVTVAQRRLAFATRLFFNIAVLERPRQRPRQRPPQRPPQGPSQGPRQRRRQRPHDQ